MSQDKPFKASMLRITSPFVSISCVSPVAQQGEALLWSSWLEKHPDTDVLSAEDSGTLTAVWDDPDTKAVWDKHVAETYYSYWEQYTYWAAQGWTTDQSVSNGNTDGEAAAAVMDRGIQTHLKELRDGAESQQREEFKALHDNVEVLNNLFGHSCTLEEAGSSVMDSDRQCVSVAVDGERCGSDDPHDGGNDRKRPAASSQQSVAEHTGNKCVCVSALPFMF